MHTETLNSKMNSNSTFPSSVEPFAFYDLYTQIEFLQGKLPLK